LALVFESTSKDIGCSLLRSRQHCLAFRYGNVQEVMPSFNINSPKIYGNKPRRLKYFFVLFKNIVVVSTSLIELFKVIKVEGEIIARLNQIPPDTNIRDSEDAASLVWSLILHRRE
jgi:hypothetical protein